MTCHQILLVAIPATRARISVVVFVGPIAGSAKHSSAARSAPSGSLPCCRYSSLLPPSLGSNVLLIRALPVAGSMLKESNVADAFAAVTVPVAPAFLMRSRT